MSCPTTLVVTRDHADLIRPTLATAPGPVLVADLGSRDDTVAICRELGAKVFEVRGDDFSRAKNLLAGKAETDWLFCLEPGEEVVSGEIDVSAGDMYRVLVVNGDLLTRETRVWRKGAAKFVRPAFETLEPDLATETLPVVVGGTTRRDSTAALRKWREESPLAPEPDYYEACLRLMAGDHAGFAGRARHYLFRSPGVSPSTVLTRYYLARVVRNKNPGEALKLILECLAAYPLMAEFWCLLGDVYMTAVGEYDKAYLFYENAIILGGRRLEADTMPTEISKYDDYPRKMMGVAAAALEKITARPASA